MKAWKAVLLTFLAVAIVVAAYGALLIRRGFSAKETPSLPEVTIARALRNLAIPSKAKNENNPFTATPEILKQAQEHFADHCATCHANNGSGQTEIGQNFYPKTPDMRLPETQKLADGEIYYIIHNGVRLTGMPAWGQADNDPDSWKLVLFIRHLPKLTPEELKDMEHFNPTSEVDREEEQKEQEFLNGEDSPDKSKKEQNRHLGEEK